VEPPANPGWFNVLSRWFGLTMMSILADECARSEQRLVTDEEDSYAALGRYLTTIGGGEYGYGGNEHERLALVTIPIFDLEEVSLTELLNLRERESSFLRELRHAYLSAVDETVRQLSTTTMEIDRNEISRIFEQRMRDSANELKRALRRVATQSLLSQPVLIALLAAAGAIVEPWTSSVVGVGSLAHGLSKYREAREQALRKSAMSWLYLARGRFQLI
jgi:hypothetical protein